MPNYKYQLVDTPQVHNERRIKMIQAHPEIKALIGPNPFTFFFILLISFLQFGFALLLKSAAWWEVLVFSFLFGGFASHALFVLYHECTHDLVFKSSTANRLLAIFTDFAIGIPSAMGFRKYHIIHHTHLGDIDLDPDLVSEKEGRMIGNSPIRKALWLMFFSVSQSLRPMKCKKFPFWDKWIVLNLVLVIIFEGVCLFFFGFQFYVYLILSTFFALGLHPVGGRWIQEHYISKQGQETYSYYGPLNLVAFNMGYHSEHHDFMMIPWNRLPRLKAIAPEVYNPLKSYHSWIQVIWKWIFDPEFNAFSRMVRKRKPVIAMNAVVPLEYPFFWEHAHHYSTPDQQVMH